MKTALDLLRADGARSERVAMQMRSAPVVAKTASSLAFARGDDIAGGTQAAKLNKPYAQSVWVQRGIKFVAGPISAVPLYFEIDAKEFDDPKLAEFWRQPAVRLNFDGFVRATVGWRRLAGESFWILGDDAIVPFPEVRDLRRASKMIVARPDRMRHVVDRGELIGWDYTDGAGRRHSLLPQQVIHLKEWNPYDEFRGLSEFEAASIAAETDYLAGVFERNLMRNNGDRGPYIVAKSGIPDDGQKEQIIATLRAKQSAAGRGQFRPAFFTGDITVQDPEIQVVDSALLAMRVQSRQEILISLGCPPSMGEPTASYSVGSASDRYRLIEETCMPESNTIAGGIETVSRTLTGKPVVAAFDWDENSTMQAVRRERIASAQALWGMGVPLKVANNNLRLGLEPVPGWDVGYLPFSVAPIGSLPPEQDPALAEPVDTPPDSSVEDMLKTLADRRARKAVPICSRSSAAGDSFQKARDPKEAALWRAQAAKRRESQKRYLSAINRQLLSARAEVLQKIEARYTPTEKSATVVVRAVAADLMFDPKVFSDGLFAKMRKAATQALQSGGADLFAELKKDDPFTMAAEDVLKFIRERENKLSDTPDDIWQSIKNVLQQGIDDGVPRKELADQVRAAFNGISNGRAETIATTEANTAYNDGRQKAMNASGIKWKQWLTSNNDNVRDAHREANGQIVPVDESFIVGGEELMHPCDPSGAPGNVINCHCVSIPVANGPEENA